MRLFKQQMPDSGIVYQRGTLQFWLPSSMANELPYNPQHLPVQRIPDALWYYMWYEALKLAYKTCDDALSDELLVEVLRR